jgi:NADP-dependent 3-hydroxy acid dehydrogenase YdfG
MWDDATTWRVIVTGGSSGLGAATCHELQTLGASVVSLDRQHADAVSTIVTNLADGAEAERSTQRAIEGLGGVDAVICCAGRDVPGPITSLDRSTWEHIVAVNLIGTAVVVRTALPALERDAGRVVTIASTLGHRAVGDATAYCASKFGVVGFTRALAAEYRGRVGVTLLTPGGMHTPFFDDRDEQYKPPAGASLADPAHIAQAVVWILGRPAGVEVKEMAIMSPGEGSWP